MNTTTLKFANMGNNYTSNSFIISPATWVTGNDTRRDYKKSPLLDENTAAILVAMAASDSDVIDLRKFALSRGKRSGNLKNLADTHPACHSLMKGKRDFTTASSARAWKALATSGSHHLSAGIRKHRQESRRNENGQRKKSVRWLDLENEKKGKEAVDGLVGLMNGFGIGGRGGERVQKNIEVDMEGLESDMGGLAVRMAMLEVMRRGDGEML